MKITAESISCYSCGKEFDLEFNPNDVVDDGQVWDVYVALLLLRVYTFGRCTHCHHKHDARWLTDLMEAAYRQDETDESERARDDFLESARVLSNEERS